MNFPTAIENLDDLLKCVQKLHAEVGGSTPVRTLGSCNQVFHCKLSTAALGKSDQSKLVSRGGIPRVLIG